MAAPSVRLGVDIGGTFTDVVLEKDAAATSTKVLTFNSGRSGAWSKHDGLMATAFPSERSVELINLDLARGYISTETAVHDYNLTPADIAGVEAAVVSGDTL